MSRKKQASAASSSAAAVASTSSTTSSAASSSASSSSKQCAVPQTAPIKAGQVKNSAGGFVFQITDMQRLRRFLVLGSEGGTYYISERKLGVENAQAIQRLIASDQGEQVVAEIVDFSVNNRAPKQEPLLFALAMCARSDKDAVKKAAYAAVQDVCRIPTHLFSFVEYCQLLSRADGGRGCGRAHRRAISDFYNRKSAKQVAYLVTKFANRNGWTHCDLLRLCHVAPGSRAHDLIFHYVTKGWEGVISNPRFHQIAVDATASADPVSTATASTAAVSGPLPALASTEVSTLPASACDAESSSKPTSTASSTVVSLGQTSSPVADKDEFDKVFAFLGAVEICKAAQGHTTVVPLIRQFHLAREHLPTQLLNSAPVWEALLVDMPMTAMIRNLAKMTSIGLLAPHSAGTKTVATRLRDRELLHRARIHPFQVLLALRTYERGHGEKGKLSWQPVAEIVAALDDAFYAAFNYVEPTNKRMLLALDVSGSMAAANILNAPNVSARVAACAMAMLAARTERHTTFMAFSRTFVPFPVSKSARLDEVMRSMDRMPFSSTDCSLPMTWALKSKVAIDTFVVYTDNETYAGKVHPSVALKEYREKMGIPAKLIVVGLTSTGFSIADPSDAGMLDVVGFDAAAPDIMANFIMDRM